MKYTLVIDTNTVMVFHILAVAELYKTLYGGTLFVSSDDGVVKMSKEVK